MEKTQLHSLVVLQVKIIYCLLAALGLSVIAVLDLLESKYLFATVAASFSLGLVVYAGYLLLRRKKRSSPYPEWLLVGLLCVFTLFGMQESAQVVHWIYFVPIYSYFLFSLRVASYITLVYSVALVALVLLQFDPYLRLQTLFTYAACYVFSVMYALINEHNGRGMTQVVHTDSLTQVYNEHQLLLDLNKEITRADRMRCDLMLVTVTTPERWQCLKVEDYEQRLLYLGRRIKPYLRPYDTCYRMQNDDFIVLMPHSDEQQAQQLASQLRDSLTNSRLQQEVIGIAVEAYQPEDDVETLLQRVQGGSL
ncbi:diguanylate cyclase domain-containing protein [Bacterioplanes sanyensis]|nr:diguanylate cyclase [Bacterioplanes sanyensis]